MSSDDEQRKALEAELRKLLEGMTAEEALILRKRFGIEFNSSASLEEIAKQLEAPRQRIREIEQRALKKLRNGRGPDDAA